MSDVNVEEAATAVANAITSRIEAALAQVEARVEHLRAQLAQLDDPVALAEQRRVMARAAERLRVVAGAG